MAARKGRITGKETRTEREERESIQEFGSIVCPSYWQASPVIAHLQIGSQYRVYYRDGGSELVSGAQLKRLLREDLAAEAVA